MKTAKEQADDLIFLYSSIIRNSIDSKNELDKSSVFTLVKLCAKNACVLAKIERDRAVDIAYQFREKQMEAYESKKKAGNEYAFMSENIAEECRYVGNAISGHNALSVALNKKDYWDEVIEEIENK